MSNGGESPQSALPDMNTGAEKIQTMPVYRQNGLSNNAQDLLCRNPAKKDQEYGGYWLNPDPLKYNEGEKEEEEEEGKNNNLKKKEDETCRTEFIKVLKGGYKGLPEGFEEWSFEQMKQWMLIKGYKVNKLPKSLAFLVPGFACPGDCGRSGLEKPDWLDPDLFRRGQKFAMDNFFSICFANVISLCLTYTDKEALKPLIITGRSSTPYLAFKRFSSTVSRVRTWYTEDPWEEGSAAFRNIAIVRGYHTSIRNRLRDSNQEKIDADSRITDPWSSICEVFAEDANSVCPMHPNSYDLTKMKYRSIGLNQAEMSVTQFMFTALTVIYPETFGIHNADETDLKAFCHLWRCIGYLLGIEDEYNFCHGSLSEIKQRMKDVIDTAMTPNFPIVNAEWEHMTRCMLRGINYYIPTPEYETTILYMTDMLKIPMPRLLSSVDYVVRIRLAFLKFFFQYIVKIPGVIRYCNAMVNARIDKALAFSPKEHSRLEEKSTKTLLDFTLG